MGTGTIALIISCLVLLVVIVVGVYLIRKHKYSIRPDADDSNGSTQKVLASVPAMAEKTEVTAQEGADFSTVISDAALVELISDQNPADNLRFERADESDGKLYKEIIMSGASTAGGFGAKVGSAVGQQVFTMHQLALLAPNGLFTATTNPSMLTRFADGTVSTMVHGNKGIVANFGFEQVQGISMFNPAMIINVGMQGMALISGQYYLKRLNDRMEKLDSKVDELLQYQKAEKIADLKHGWEIMRKMSARENADSHDIERIMRIIDDFGKVYEQYKIMAEQKYRELKRFSGEGGTAEARLEEYRLELLKLQEYLEICFIADQMRLKAQMAEIIIRQRIDLRDPKIPELREELISDLENSFSCNTCEDFDGFTEPLLKRAELLSARHRGLAKVIKSWRVGSQKVSEELMEPVMGTMCEMQNGLKELVDTDICRSALQVDEENRNMLLMPGKEGQDQRVFVEITEEGTVE